MSKFCNQCGSKLVDGKCPNCSNTEEKEEEIKEDVVQETTINMEDVKNKVKDFKDSPMVQKVITYYKSSILNPIKSAKDDTVTQKFNWLICLLNSLIIGLMTFIFLNVNLAKLAQAAENWSKSLIGYSNTNFDVKLPALKILLFVTIISVISNIVIVILEKIFFGLFCRNKSKISKYFSRQMVSYTIFAIAYAVAIVASFISLKLFFMIFVLGLVIDVVLLVQLFLTEKSTKKNVLAIVTPIYVVTSIIAVIIVWIMGISAVVYNSNASSSIINDSFIESSSSGYDSFNW